MVSVSIVDIQYTYWIIEYFEILQGRHKNLSFLYTVKYPTGSVFLWKITISFVIWALHHFLFINSLSVIDPAKNGNWTNPIGGSNLITERLKSFIGGWLYFRGRQLNLIPCEKFLNIIDTRLSYCPIFRRKLLRTASPKPN